MRKARLDDSFDSSLLGPRFLAQHGAAVFFLPVLRFLTSLALCKLRYPGATDCFMRNSSSGVHGDPLMDLHTLLEQSSALVEHEELALLRSAVASRNRLLEYQASVIQRLERRAAVLRGDSVVQPSPPPRQGAPPLAPSPRAASEARPDLLQPSAVSVA